MPFRAFVFSMASAPIMRIVFSENTLPSNRFFTKSLPAAESLSSPSRNPATSFRPITPLSIKRFSSEFIAVGLLKNASRLPLPSISAIMALTSSVLNTLAFFTDCSVLPILLVSCLLKRSNVLLVSGIFLSGTKYTVPLKPASSICFGVQPKPSAFSLRLS